MGSNKFDDSGVMDLTKNIMIMLFLGVFMIIIFVAFFHFYAKRRGPQATIHDTNNRVHDQQQGLDASFLETIRVMQFDPKEFKQGLECAVCLSEVEQGEIVRILPKCGHGFHVECIDTWFRSHSTCPVCRSPVIESEPEQDLQEEFTNFLLEIDETNQASSSEQASSSSSTSSLSSQTYDNKNRERPHLVIDIPPRDNIVDEDEKTPVSCSGARSLKRILSNSARFNPFSPGS